MNPGEPLIQEPDIIRTTLERFAMPVEWNWYDCFPSGNIHYIILSISSWVAKAMRSWVTKMVCGAGEVEECVRGFLSPLHAEKTMGKSRLPLASTQSSFETIWSREDVIGELCWNFKLNFQGYVSVFMQISLWGRVSPCCPSELGEPRRHLRDFLGQVLTMSITK